MFTLSLTLFGVAGNVLASSHLNTIVLVGIIQIFSCDCLKFAAMHCVFPDTRLRTKLADFTLGFSGLLQPEVFILPLPSHCKCSTGKCMSGLPYLLYCIRVCSLICIEIINCIRKAKTNTFTWLTQTPTLSCGYVLETDYLLSVVRSSFLAFLPQCSPRRCIRAIVG